jgi:hypothetical protein
MLFMLWMRSYPSYHLLSLLFDVSVTTVHDEINWCIPIMWEQFHALVQWPSLDEYIIFHFYSVFRYQTVQFPAFPSYTIAENLIPGYAQFAASI